MAVTPCSLASDTIRRTTAPAAPSITSRSPSRRIPQGVVAVLPAVRAHPLVAQGKRRVQLHLVPRAPRGGKFRLPADAVAFRLFRRAEPQITERAGHCGTGVRGEVSIPRVRRNSMLVA